MGGGRSHISLMNQKIKKKVCFRARGDSLLNSPGNNPPWLFFLGDFGDGIFIILLCGGVFLYISNPPLRPFAFCLFEKNPGGELLTWGFLRGGEGGGKKNFFFFDIPGSWELAKGWGLGIQFMWN